MNRCRYISKAMAVFCCSMFLCGALFAKDDGLQSPNIILILSDDQGWNALSVRMDPDVPGSGSTYHRTPRLAKLASEGIRFPQAYLCGATCSPSRHGIQFGRTPASIGFFSGQAQNVTAENKDSLANILKSVRPDYVTAHFGKWHIKRKLKDMGYDEDDGMNENLEGNSKDPNDPKLMFSLTAKANNFMERQVNAGKPFYLQVSHYANHSAWQSLKTTLSKYGNEYSQDRSEHHRNHKYGAMNENLDTCVGILLDKIEELGIKNNTYVIYTSDNGYESRKDYGKPVAQRSFGMAHPLLSHKYMINEGGIRVPFIVRGPGITANSISHVPVIGYDIFPTVMDIVGKGSDIPKIVEGGSLLPLMQNGGNGEVKRKDPFFIFRYDHLQGSEDIAVVQDDYKLLKEIDSGLLHLWNLKEDIGEQNNLIDVQPERAKSMYKAMTDYFDAAGWRGY